LASRQAPQWSRPYELLAGLYLAQQQPAKAVAKLKAGLSANPASLELTLALGALQEQRGDFAGARSTYEQGLKQHANVWQLLNNLAFLLAAESDDKADWNRASELAERARVLAPSEPAVLDTLGWLSYRRGDLAGAKLNLDKAIKLSPRDAEINYHLACLLKRDGQTKSAKAHLKTALASGRNFHGRKQAESLLKQI
jgi:Flp pilus assembly protein TadD